MPCDAMSLCHGPLPGSLSHWVTFNALVATPLLAGESAGSWLLTASYQMSLKMGKKENKDEAKFPGDGGGVLQVWRMHRTGRPRARMDVPRRSKARLPPKSIEQSSRSASPASTVMVVSMLISSGSPAEAMDGRKGSRL